MSSKKSASLTHKFKKLLTYNMEQAVDFDKNESSAEIKYRLPSKLC